VSVKTNGMRFTRERSYEIAVPGDLMRVSQFLSLNAPETPTTRHFLNTKTIALLPEHAIVVNTARGGLIKDDDLIEALKSGRVAAAGLDVYEGEPSSIQVTWNSRTRSCCPTSERQRLRAGRILVWLHSITSMRS
jgi:phosphoglycerate dehydrogenase-like enzyme